MEKLKFTDAESVIILTKRCLSNVLNQDDLDFLDKAMRQYAANAIHEFLAEKGIAA